MKINRGRAEGVFVSHGYCTWNVIVLSLLKFLHNIFDINLDFFCGTKFHSTYWKTRLNNGIINFSKRVMWNSRGSRAWKLFYILGVWHSPFCLFLSWAVSSVACWVSLLLCCDSTVTHGLVLFPLLYAGHGTTKA